MAPALAEPRLAPLGNAPLSGYVPHRPRLEPDSGSGGGVSPGTEERAPAALGDSAEALCEDSAPELWPDTDSNAEECERPPCSRGLALAPAPAGAGAGRRGGPRCAREAPLRPAATAPPGGAVHPCAAAAPVVALAPVGLLGFLERAPPPERPAPPTPEALAAWHRGPRFLGSQAARGVLVEVARGAPVDAAAARMGSTSPPPSAVRDAEIALAALEPAEGDEGNAPPEPLPVGVTTLVLRNLPCEMTQRELLDEIRRSGFANACDFCYLPRGLAPRKTGGHAFVNLASSGAAAEFCRAWRGRPTCAGHAVRGGGIDVSVAELQGLASNAAKWDGPRMRRVRNPDLRPFVLYP